MRNTLWTAPGLEWRQKSWSFKNAVNDTVHEILDLNHKSSSAHVSATTKKNTHSQGNVQICKEKNINTENKHLTIFLNMSKSNLPWDNLQQRDFYSGVYVALEVSLMGKKSWTIIV